MAQIHDCPPSISTVRLQRFTDAPAILLKHNFRCGKSIEVEIEGHSVLVNSRTLIHGVLALVPDALDRRE